MKRTIGRPRTRLTQAGATFCLIALLVQMAAFTTGENLLYLLSAGVGSLLLLSAVITRLTLRKVSVERAVPDTAERDALFRSVVRIHNGKQRFSAVSLRVRGGNEPGARDRHLGSVSPGETLPLWLGHRFPRRGTQKLPPIRVESGFPLGLLRTSLELDDRAETIILPRVHRLKPAAVNQLDGAGEKTRRDLGEGDEFFSLREYVPGDDIRRIAWKVSARLGRYVVRELEPTVARNVRIYFDTRVPAGSLDSGMGLPPEIDEEFERAVDLTASLASAFLDKQYLVSLTTPQDTIAFGEGQKHAMRVLRMLAHVTPEPYSEQEWPGADLDPEGAAVALVSANAHLWGQRMPGSRAKVLNPHEVSYA